MTEQILVQIPDTIETPPVNSLIRRSISNRLDSTSLTSDDVLAQLMAINLTEDAIEKGAAMGDSDNDSFDDEADDEHITFNALYRSFSTNSANYALTTCPICFESSILQSASCCKFRCCNSCWRAHISSTINDGRVKISCASSECNKFLVRDTIVNLIRFDTNLQELYLKLYANANQNPRAKTCPRCSHLYSLDMQSSTNVKNSKKSNKKIPKQIQCSECSLVWCFRCSAPWHENLTCKQFTKGDKLLSKWINQKSEDQWNARKCPKCSSVIQRNGGCPHMTCSSCSCEFCYLCGRRYIKIPVIGQHNNKFSMLGCPYNLHPERPWLRRTIRGAIATGVVVAAPLLAVGAITAAVTVLPSVGIYRFVRHLRNRRYTRGTIHDLMGEQEMPFDQEAALEALGMEVEETSRALRASPVIDDTITMEDDFPLSIYADMDVEKLFVEDERSTSDFISCPTTPAINVREDTVIVAEEQ